jgi:hypothetical protein
MIASRRLVIVAAAAAIPFHRPTQNCGVAMGPNACMILRSYRARQHPPPILRPLDSPTARPREHAGFGNGKVQDGTRKARIPAVLGPIVT